MFPDANLARPFSREEMTDSPLSKVKGADEPLLHGNMLRRKNAKWVGAWTKAKPHFRTTLLDKDIRFV